MKKNHIIFTLLMLFSVGKVTAQQNIQFTQYVLNSLSINPAYAGYKEEWYGQVGFRSQWVGLEGAPKTGFLSVDGVTNQANKKHGVGFQVKMDGLGPYSATSANANYAFRLRLDEEDTRRLSFGLGVSITQYSLDGSKLNGLNGNDPVLPTSRINNYIPDIHLGVYYSSSSWFVGLSVLDVLSTEEKYEDLQYDNNTPNLIRRKPHMYFSTGTVITLEEDVKLRPSILWQEDFNGPSNLDFNALLIMGEGQKLGIGLGYRTGFNLWDKEYKNLTQQSLKMANSFSGIIQFRPTEKIILGYSYDYVVSKLSSIQNGSHELGIGFLFGKNSNSSEKPKYF